MATSSRKIQLHFSHAFSSAVWKTIVDEETNLIFIESRDSEAKKVTFSACSVANGNFLWTDLEFDEKWWLSLSFASNGVLLLTHYTDTNNPAKKSTIAFDIHTRQIVWWKNNFVVSRIDRGVIAGQDTKFGSRTIFVDIKTGSETPRVEEEVSLPQNFQLIQPLRYLEATNHFETVKTFVERKCGFSPVHVIEYCEVNSCIVVSAFSREDSLANYLIVFNPEGEIVLKEQLGENLKGFAYDTFFILSGFLIFVKNKRELVSYRFV